MSVVGRSPIEKIIERKIDAQPMRVLRLIADQGELAYTIIHDIELLPKIRKGVNKRSIDPGEELPGGVLVNAGNYQLVYVIVGTTLYVVWLSVFINKSN